MNWISRLKGLFATKPEPARDSGSAPTAWASMAALLEDLEIFGKEHAELYDTDVRERLWEAFETGLIKQSPNFSLPRELGMFSPEANRELVALVGKHLEHLRKIFIVLKLDTEEKRRNSFLNSKLHTESGLKVEEFFGSP